MDSVLLFMQGLQHWDAQPSGIAADAFFAPTGAGKRKREFGAGSQGKAHIRVPGTLSCTSGCFTARMAPAASSASHQTGGTSSQKASWKETNAKPTQKHSFYQTLVSHTEEPTGFIPPSPYPAAFSSAQTPSAQRLEETDAEETAPKSHCLDPNPLSAPVGGRQDTKLLLPSDPAWCLLFTAGIIPISSWTGAHLELDCCMQGPARLLLPLLLIPTEMPTLQPVCGSCLGCYRHSLRLAVCKVSPNVGEQK